MFQDYKKEAEEYLNSDLTCILYNPQRQTLIDALCSKKSEQLEFFGDKRIKLDNVLQEILDCIQNKKYLYARWTQTTKGGKKRELNVPNKPLRSFFEDYLLDFIKLRKVHENCHGGENGWSTKKSLETHLPCEGAFSFDIKDAFPNIDFEKVFGLFYSLLGDMPYQNRRDSAGILAFLSTVKYDNKRGLPIGSPISMAMFNRILYPLDKILFSKSNEKGFSYSRWVDDITISSPLDIGIEYFLGSLDLVDLPIARDKVFFQGSCNIYLLGHKIVSGKFIYKNTKEEKLKNKSPPVNLDEFKNYEAWG